MRTKALFVAAFLAAGLASSMAQNVYSLNVVGYYNVTMKPGFTMFANQFQTTNNTLAALIPTAPPGANFYKFATGSGWTPYTFDDLDGWLPDGNVTLAPGEGGFFRNPTSSDVTLTFVGEVMQGALTTELPAGFSVRSSKVPQAGTATALGVPAAPGDNIYTHATVGGYTPFTFDDLDGWLPAEPNIAVGQAFFVRKNAAANWVRNFTVQ
ncbi:MAG TPA: hypothetical protein VI136_21770 [Verrucomicrobiae bacterium]